MANCTDCGTKLPWYRRGGLCMTCAARALKNIKRHPSQKLRNDNDDDDDANEKEK